MVDFPLLEQTRLLAAAHIFAQEMQDLELMGSAIQEPYQWAYLKVQKEILLIETVYLPVSEDTHTLGVRE
jgi:hypothetical protein